MILVTGATGELGKKAISHLIKKGIQPSQVIGLVRDESKAQTLKDLGVQVRKGDYKDANSLVHAFKGVEKLLFISSSEIHNRAAQHKNVVEAAQSAGIKHIAYTSFVRNSEISESAISFLQDSHLKTENWIKESGIDYTILQNAMYMDMLPMFIGESVLDTGVIVQPAKDGKVTPVTRDNLAEAAANVLTTTGHQNKIYPLSNTDASSYDEIAQMITKATGKEIKYQSPSPEAFQEMLKGYGVPEDYIGIFTAFSVAQAQGELEVADNTLEGLLGRKPTSTSEFISQVYSS